MKSYLYGYANLNSRWIFAKIVDAEAFIIAQWVNGKAKNL